MLAGKLLASVPSGTAAITGELCAVLPFRWRELLDPAIERYSLAPPATLVSTLTSIRCLAAFSFLLGETEKLTSGAVSVT